jgi:microcystin-dependent protein
MKIELNGKALIGILALSVGIASANFVSLVDSEGAGGIKVINETIIDTTPVGTVAMWATNTTPNGWIEMNGQSTDGYPELASVVGANVPDLRGEFVRGWDNGRGIDSGRGIATSQLDQIQNITGSMDVAGYYSSTSSIIDSHQGALYNKGATNRKSGLLFDSNASGRRSAAVGFDASRVARTGDETRGRNISLMYIIKAEK